MLYREINYKIIILFRLRSQVFPAITAAEEITENDTDSEVDTKKKRYRKEKIGFRDRKVFFFISC